MITSRSWHYCQCLACGRLWREKRPPPESTGSAAYVAKDSIAPIFHLHTPITKSRLRDSVLPLAGEIIAAPPVCRDRRASGVIPILIQPLHGLSRIIERSDAEPANAQVEHRTRHYSPVRRARSGQAYFVGAKEVHHAADEGAGRPSGVAAVDEKSAARVKQLLNLRLLQRQ